MKNIFLWIGILAFSATFTMGEGKCNSGKAESEKSMPFVKKDTNATQKPKEVPKKESSKCGQGKCG